MGSEFEQLRRFGKQVQIKQKRAKNNETNNIFMNNLINFFKNFLYFIKGKFEWLYYNIVFSKKLKKKNYLIKKSERKRKFGSIIVEYQKQWINTSIIIRRRKKIQYDNNKVSPLHSTSFSYYFNRIDGEEEKQKSRFSPKGSSWDFHYSSKKILFTKIKDIFSK